MINQTVVCENYTKGSLSIAHVHMHTSLSVHAVQSKSNFGNSWITSTRLHIFVMSSVLETFLIHHLESIDGFAFSLSALRVLSMLWGLRRYQKFCLHVGDLPLLICNRFNKTYDETKKTREVENFTLAMRFLLFLLPTCSCPLQTECPWRLKRKTFTRCSVCFCKHFHSMEQNDKCLQPSAHNCGPKTQTLSILWC